MRSILRDGNAYVAFKLGDEKTVAVIQRCPDLLICTNVLGELLAGFAAGPREARNREELSAFMRSPRVHSVVCAETAADNYALVFTALRRKGRPIPSNDWWIAASALEYGAGLLTRDAHFAEIDGLRCGQQAADFLP
jgi:predicted nucleic acid-binding protein